jgi:hypothetical protein
VAETATYPTSAPAAADLPADITDDTDSKAGTPRTGTVGFLAKLLSRAGVELRAVIGDLITARGSFVDLATRLNARITVRNTADRTITTTTNTALTDLAFILAPNTDYSFRFVLLHTSAGTARGVGYALTFGGTVTRLGARVVLGGTAASGVDAETVGWLTASGTAFTTAAYITANLVTTAIIEGVIQVGATGGTLQLNARQGTGATAANQIVYKGSWGELVAA